MPMARPAIFTAQNDIKYVVDATSVGNKKVAQTGSKDLFGDFNEVS